MGTNYYLHRDTCPMCGRSDEPLHIGKSSAGWCFSLHVMPEQGINDLPDWQREWEKGGIIKDEYGDEVSLTDMLGVITQRAWRGQKAGARWHDENGSEPGPNGLARHRRHGSCIAHGVGTWDCITGAFS